MRLPSFFQPADPTARALAQFRRKDRDRDGQLSAKEIGAWGVLDHNLDTFAYDRRTTRDLLGRRRTEPDVRGHAVSRHEWLFAKVHRPLEDRFVAAEGVVGMAAATADRRALYAGARAGDFAGVRRAVERLEQRAARHGVQGKQPR